MSTIPASVSRGGGPDSGNVLSKCRGRGFSNTMAAPFASSIGVQCVRSVEVARWMAPSPQYIQYLPSILAAMRRPLSLSKRVTMPADLHQILAYLPPEADWKIYAIEAPRLKLISC